MPLRVNQLNGFGVGGGLGPAPGYVAKTDYTASTSNPATQAHTKNASTKGLIVCTLGITVSITGITYGGVSMTLVGDVSTAGAMYYINNPASGSQTISVAKSGAGFGGFITVIEFDQNILPTDFASANAATLTQTWTPSISSGIALWNTWCQRGTGPSMSGTGVTNIGDYQFGSGTDCCGSFVQRVGTAYKTNTGASVSAVTIANNVNYGMRCTVGPAPT